MNKLNLQKTTLAYIGVAVVGLTLSSAAFAVTPPPDGGYAGANTAEGGNALLSLTTGTWNTAIGANALKFDTTGGFNTAVGGNALLNNSNGVNNTAVGVNALGHNTSGTRNTAVGQGALGTSMTAGSNTATGFQALAHNASGTPNTAFGAGALFNNISTSFNVAVGDSALANFNGTTAFDGANTALGSIALLSETSGQENVAVGRRALESLATGSNNTAVGWRAGDSYTGGESGNIIIGSAVLGVSGENNTTRIGNIYSSIASARAVYVDADNKIGTLASSRRYKDEIKPMNKASESLLALKPVTFRYKKEFDRDQTPMFGLIAEEVEKVNPDLVSRNDKGDVETVRYDAVNAMLLNEFLKEHGRMQEVTSTVATQQNTIAELRSTIAQQQKAMDVLTAQLKEQAAQIQKVSSRLESNQTETKIALH